MKIIFIPKPGKVDYTVPKAFRPITLSSFLLKGLEKVVLLHIKETYDTTLFQQHAFTEGRSTETALDHITDYIERSFDRQEFVVAAFLDLKGAFDNVKYEAIKRAMERRGIDKTLINWYDNLGKNRQLECEIGGICQTHKPSKGTAQGGIISPLVFIMVMDTLLETFRHQPIKVFGYADDIALVAVGPSLTEATNRVQNGIDRATKWASTQGLEFSPQKTGVMIFTRKRKWKQKDVILTMYDTRLELQDSVKYLGIWLDNKLSYKKHVKEKVKECKQCLMCVKRVVGDAWGLDANKLKWIYNSMIKPRLTYGALVWSHKCDQTIRKEMNKLQRLFLLMVSGAMRTTPTAGMEVIMDVMPLDILAQGMALRAKVRIRDQQKCIWDGTNKQGTLKGHNGLLEKWSKDAKIGGLSNMAKGRFYGQVNIKVDKEQCCQVQKTEHKIDIFVDGSVQEGTSGIGWVVYWNGAFHSEGRQRCDDGLLPLTVELAAIEKGCKVVRDLSADGLDKKAEIYSDCRTALTSLKTKAFNSKIHKNILNYIQTGGQNNIWLTWIKGHGLSTRADIPGNILPRRADILAKEATRCRQTKLFYNKTAPKLRWHLEPGQTSGSFISGHCTLNYWAKLRPSSPHADSVIRAPTRHRPF